jgi:glycine cleavage system H protein
MPPDEPYPADLLYHPEHDWARLEGNSATLGITWYAQEQLGQIVYWEPPALGEKVTKDQPYTELESVKAVSDVIAPLSGEIVAVNQAVADTPEIVNDAPYDGGWLVRLRLDAPSEADDLLSVDAYRELLG